MARTSVDWSVSLRSRDPRAAGEGVGGCNLGLLRPPRAPVVVLSSRSLAVGELPLDGHIDSCGSPLVKV